jgi:hypothetical protein
MSQKCLLVAPCCGHFLLPSTVPNVLKCQRIRWIVQTDTPLYMAMFSFLKCEDIYTMISCTLTGILQPLGIWRMFEHVVFVKWKTCHVPCHMTHYHAWSQQNTFCRYIVVGLSVWYSWIPITLVSWMLLDRWDSSNYLLSYNIFVEITLFFLVISRASNLTEKDSKSI